MFQFEIIDIIKDRYYDVAIIKDSKNKLLMALYRTGSVKIGDKIAPSHVYLTKQYLKNGLCEYSTKFSELIINEDL